MPPLEQLQQHIAWLLAHDEPADPNDAAGLPLLELVPSRPHPGWDWLPEFLKDTPATDWLPQLGGTVGLPSSARSAARITAGPAGSATRTRVASAVDVTALRAGLLLLHDFIDESHQQSQSIEGEGEHQLGDYWHAILHRREPDYGNAKYWFRQIGRHPVFPELARRANVLLQSSPSPNAPRWRSKLATASDWNPFAFVDLCESCASSPDPDLTLAARQIQFAEMVLLFRQTYRQATG